MAFSDKPKESNSLFTKALGMGNKKGKGTYSALLQKRPDVAEMVAKALNHNLANAPDSFPRALRIYLAPPAARTKGSEKTEGEALRENPMSKSTTLTAQYL
jgi:hypothetical protein